MVESNTTFNNNDQKVKYIFLVMDEYGLTFKKFLMAFLISDNIDIRFRKHFWETECSSLEKLCAAQQIVSKEGAKAGVDKAICRSDFPFLYNLILSHVQLNIPQRKGLEN
ncbi:hypothetical protein VP01_625g4 [Puccinia sorghi]|uniref:Uncharacterized protein n=1 Tax=Puccinia sorghi TaxID=27349 RepID=A0A0L6UGF0_9BASI|nr:hypothetical protein VP01_625g4 [Puccinia sorghi]